VGSEGDRCDNDPLVDLAELPASAEAKAGSKEAVSLIARHSEELSPDCLVSSLPGNVSLSEVSELLAAAGTTPLCTSIC